MQVATLETRVSPRRRETIRQPVDSGVVARIALAIAIAAGSTGLLVYAAVDGAVPRLARVPSTASPAGLLEDAPPRAPAAPSTGVGELAGPESGCGRDELFC